MTQLSEKVVCAALLPLAIKANRETAEAISSPAVSLL